MTPLASRLNALRRRLRKEGLDAVYIGSQPNVRYLTGFSGSAAHLLVVADGAVLVTDGRYTVQAATEISAGVEIVAEMRDAAEMLAEQLAALKVRRLGFERNRLSFAAHAGLEAADPRRKLVPLDGWVEEQRMVKTEEEIAAIREAIGLASDAFEQWLQKLSPRWTEQRAAGELDYLMRRRGAEGSSFPTIVASGAHSALPHAKPRDVALGRNSLILADHGAILGGYSSDMTRVVATGDPGPELRRMHQAVLDALESAVSAVRAGVKASTVDRAAREALGRAGLAETFTHSTGHGLGLEVHEGPRLGPKQDVRLKSGMTVTIEPGAYVEGVGGVRIEDVVAVRPDGCERLTSTPRELRSV